MMRDARMSLLVPTEPITPFLHTVRALYRDRGVSTVLVAGSCGDFFDCADTVICMQVIISPVTLRFSKTRLLLD